MDIWSSGITLYAMLCGFLPFDEESKTALYDKILQCKFSVPKSISSNAADLLKKILTKDASKRIGVEDILRHPWIQTYCKEGIQMGLVVGEDKFCIDKDVCVLTAYKMKEEEMIVRKMIEDNEHNKFTTLYYLLMKKKERGDLELEKELEEYAEREKKRGRQRSRDRSGEEAKGGSRERAKKDSLPSGSRKGSDGKEAEGRQPMKKKVSGGVNVLKFIKPPPINLKDITLEVKKKITFNSGRADSRKKTASIDKRSGSQANRTGRKLSQRDRDSRANPPSLNVTMDNRTNVVNNLNATWGGKDYDRNEHWQHMRLNNSERKKRSSSRPEKEVSVPSNARNLLNKMLGKMLPMSANNKASNQRYNVTNCSGGQGGKLRQSSNNYPTPKNNSSKSFKGDQSFKFDFKMPTSKGYCPSPGSQQYLLSKIVLTLSEPSRTGRTRTSLICTKTKMSNLQTSN